MSSCSVTPRAQLGGCVLYHHLRWRREVGRWWSDSQDLVLYTFDVILIGSQSACRVLSSFWICRVWVWGKILYTLVCISTPRLGLVTPAGRRALPGRVLEHPFSVSCSPVSRARPHGLVRRRATKRASFLPNELRCVVSSTAAIAIHDCPTGITDFAYEAHHGLRIVVARRLAPWLRCIIVVRCATSYNNAKQH